MAVLTADHHGNETRSADGGPLKVLLIYPPVRLAAAPRVPPMGYLYLGSVLKAAGIEVEILDLNLDRMPIDAAMAEVRKRDFHVVGIGGMTTVYYYIKLLSRMIKDEFPHVPIMGGGSACSASPDVVLQHTGVDVACIGEGEPIIVELVERLASRRSVAHIPGIVFRADDGAIVHTAKRERFKGWRGMDFPAHELVDMETYIVNNQVKYRRVQTLAQRVEELGLDPEAASRPVHVFSKRGCPFGCTFCYRNFGRQVVYDSPEHVIDYLEFLSQKYNTIHFVFGDEIFNVSQKWVTEFCEEILRRGKKWVLSTTNGLRANCLNEEGILLMKKAGFYRLGIGIESFYDPSLKAMEKGQNSQQVIDAIKLTAKHGLHLGAGGMIFGYETDNWQAMRRNVEVLTELGYFTTMFAAPCPYPGTYLYTKAIELGLIVDEEGWLMELADRDISDRMVNVSGIPADELQAMIQWGVDQLRINSIRDRRPLIAKVLSRVQPRVRKHFDVSALEVLVDLKSGKLPFKPKRRKKGAKRDIELSLDGLNLSNEKGVSDIDANEGDRHLLIEAVERLSAYENRPQQPPLPFLSATPDETSGPALSTGEASANSPLRVVNR